MQNCAEFFQRKRSFCGNRAWNISERFILFPSSPHSRLRAVSFTNNFLRSYKFLYATASDKERCWDGRCIFLFVLAEMKILRIELDEVFCREEKQLFSSVTCYVALEKMENLKVIINSEKWTDFKLRRSTIFSLSSSSFTTESNAIFVLLYSTGTLEKPCVIYQGGKTIWEVERKSDTINLVGQATDEPVVIHETSFSQGMN